MAPDSPSAVPARASVESAFACSYNDARQAPTSVGAVLTRWPHSQDGGEAAGTDSMASLYILLAAGSFGLSLALTALMKRVSLPMGLVAYPGGRRIHVAPTPTGGGVAIFVALWTPIFLGVLACWVFGDGKDLPAALSPYADYMTGVIGHSRKLAVIFLGALIIWLIGLADDRFSLPPLPRLLAQVGVALLLMAGGMHLSIFIENSWIRGVLSVLWIVGAHQLVQFPRQHGRPLRRRKPDHRGHVLRSGAANAAVLHCRVSLLPRGGRGGVPDLQLPAGLHLHGRQRQHADRVQPGGDDHRVHVLSGSNAPIFPSWFRCSCSACRFSTLSPWYGFACARADRPGKATRTTSPTACSAWA